MQKKKKWPKEYIHWTNDQQSQIMWGDKTNILLFGSNRQKYVKRRIGKVLHSNLDSDNCEKPSYFYDLVMHFSRLY